MEYYDTAVLWKIGDKIGRTLKVDRATAVGMRGNFARLCVEVDLTKPLLAKFKLRRQIHRIMYEGLHLVCFHCGQYGHKQEFCPSEKLENQTNEEITSEMNLPVMMRWWCSMKKLTVWERLRKRKKRKLMEERR